MEDENRRHEFNARTEIAERAISLNLCDKQENKIQDPRNHIKPGVLTKNEMNLFNYVHLTELGDR